MNENNKTVDFSLYTLLIERVSLIKPTDLNVSNINNLKPIDFLKGIKNPENITTSSLIHCINCFAPSGFSLVEPPEPIQIFDDEKLTKIIDKNILIFGNFDNETELKKYEDYYKNFRQKLINIVLKNIKYLYKLKIGFVEIEKKKVDVETLNNFAFQPITKKQKSKDDEICF